MHAQALYNQKLFRFERQKEYNRHLNRISQISRKRNDSLSEYLQKKSTYSGYQIEKIRKQQMENVRLMRKLSQISTRKNAFFGSQDMEQERIIMMNMRSRESRRLMKEKELQQKNDMLVEKIVSKLSRDNSITTLGISNTEVSRIKSKKHMRSKNHSVILPRLDSHPSPSKF